MNSTGGRSSDASSPFDRFLCQPLTSLANLCYTNAVESKSHVRTFIYDISLELQIDIPENDYNQPDIMAAVSMLLTAHLFVSHSKWNFLSTPILRILDAALTRKKQKWEPKEGRIATTVIIHIMGHLININDKPKNSPAIHDNLHYNGCVDRSKIMINYKMQVLFAPGILAAKKVYESHGWKSDDTTQEEDLHSLKLSEILKSHQESGNFDHDWTWKQAFGVAVRERTRRTVSKRKYKDAA